MFSVLLLFCIGYAAGQSCQQAGSKCYSVTTAPYGVVGGSCCDSCRPYIANGGSSWDGTTDWYCQYGSTGGSEGATCGTYTGNCATGLTCTNGVCSSSSSSSNSSSVVTTASSADATTAATTCTANAGDVCEDSTYNITKTCCSPYTCETLTSRTKTCSGSNLAVNETCFDSGSSVGTCASGLVCLDGKCKETGTCADPVFPNSFCYSGEVNRQVATCCDGSYCVQPSSSSDSFCMRFDIGQGFQCGDTEARGYRGYCNTGLYCVNGVCSSSSTTSTTVAPTTTSTAAPVTTVTEQPCVGTGETCWSGSGPPTATCCNPDKPKCPVPSGICG